jgi:type VI secretion system secreted protein VgrG
MQATVDGTENGMVAPIDDRGRYTLVMSYECVAAEREGQVRRKVRMAQTSNGADYGFHFPLHVGAEVVVMHVDGDPDRPVIVGSIPNQATVSPVTDAVPTKSRIKTKSGILVEFEDAG